MKRNTKPNNSKSGKKTGASSSYNETKTIQTSKNGGTTSTIITRQISSQSSQITSSHQKMVTVQHSSSTGSVPQYLSGSSLQRDAFPWASGSGSSNNPPLTSSISPTTRPSGAFGSSTSTQPRLSLPASRSPRSPITPAPYRSAFNSTTFGSYPSRSTPPSILTQNAAQNQNTSTRSLPTRNEDVIPTYPINCKKRGRVLIINNIKFLEQQDERLGAEKDSKDLKKLLQLIGFEVDIKTNLKGKEMLTKVEKFTQMNFSNHDISMVVIMSHGNNIVKDGDKLVRIKGGYTEIAGIDNVPMLVDDVIEKFTAKNTHSSLKGKPKIFIFQCCRGEKDQEICHDAVPIKKVIKEHSDMLIAFSTLPGFISNRNPVTGTWYIQSICEVFERHYKDFHIEEMLKIVDDKLSTKHPRYTQTSTYECRGFKRCYLHPQ